MKKGHEILLGAIFILALALLYGGISFLKGRNLFSSNYNYYVRYHDVSGLSSSSPVLINGVRIGIVNDIQFNYDLPDDIVVRLGVNKRLRIPEGSCALLASELLGSVNIRLELAPDNGRYHAPGDTLKGQMSTNIRSQIARLTPQIVQLLPKVDSILTHVNQLVQHPALPHTLENAETLTNEAKATLNDLTTAIHCFNELAGTYQEVGTKLDTFTGKLNTLSDDGRIEALLSDLDVTLQNLRTISDELSQGNGTAQRLLSDPALYDRLNNVCTEASSLIEDVKQNPSRYIRIFGRSKD